MGHVEVFLAEFPENSSPAGCCRFIDVIVSANFFLLGFELLAFPDSDLFYFVFDNQFGRLLDAVNIVGGIREFDPLSDFEMVAIV